MNNNPLPIERAMWAKYAKFAPVQEPIGFRLGNLTRTYLEYDSIGNFVERDPVSGVIVDAGVIETLVPADVRDAA